MAFAVYATLDPGAGGLHQYSLSLLDALAHIAAERGGLPCRVYPGQDGAQYMTEFVRANLNCVTLGAHVGILRKSVDGFWRYVGGEQARKRWRAIRDRFRGSQVADWILFTAPDERAIGLLTPYVMPVHDLQHRLQPEFPEVSANGEWERREQFYSEAIPKADLVLVDSETGREDVVACYGDAGCTADRVRVLPFVIPHYLDAGITEAERVRVRRTYALPDRFLFYPAQFWPHKNHVRLMQALALLRREHKLEIPLVLCGAASGPVREQAYAEAMAAAQAGAVTDLVCQLGYVPDRDISALYAEATALVMPTFFGPTNIPILEAWAASCPVITSDIRGVREQVGDGGLLVDPRSPPDLADAIQRIWNDGGLRANIIAAGHRRLRAWGPADFCARVAHIVDEMEDRWTARAGGPRGMVR